MGDTNNKINMIICIVMQIYLYHTPYLFGC